MKARLRTRRGGYLLLTVAATLVVAGIILAALARHSVDLANEAAQQQKSLQRRWAFRSCRKALLPAAAIAFRREPTTQPIRRDASERRATAAIPHRFRLGVFDIEIVLGDEDAKVNLNTLYHYEGVGRVDRYLATRVRARGVRLLPQFDSMQLSRQGLDQDEGDAGRPPAFQSWGQVVDLDAATVEELMAHTTRMTLWGSGRLNVERAEDSSILECGSLAVSRGQTRELLRKLRAFPTRELEIHLSQLDLDARETYLMQDLLTQQSSCYSLWVTVADGDRRWRQLSLSEQIDASAQQSQTFAF